MKEEMTQPPAGSEPEGAGFGKPWVPQAGVTFLAFGTYVRSVVATEPLPARGLVAMDISGKWNHGAKDTLSVIAEPATAREWARLLIEAADAAERDLVAYNAKARP